MGVLEGGEDGKKVFLAGETFPLETKVGWDVESMDDDMNDILMRVEKYHDGGKKVSSASFAVATY